MNNPPAPAPGPGVPSLVAFGQHRPIVSAEAAFVAPDAVLIGRVTVSAGASIWYRAVLRADLDAIFIGERSNIQAGCALPGCPIEDQVLIGMGAIVLNGSRVGRHSIIAAGALLTEGQQVPEGVLVAGVPGKVRRELSEAEHAA